MGKVRSCLYICQQTACRKTKNCNACTSRDRYVHCTQWCITNIFLREVTGSSDALIVDMDLQLLDHVRQPIRHGPQQGVHVGHVLTKKTKYIIFTFQVCKRVYSSFAGQHCHQAKKPTQTYIPSFFSCRMMLWHSPCRNCR